MTNNSISLKQGEAKTVTITVKNSSGQAVDLTGCTLFFGMKRLVGDTTLAVSKADADMDKSQASQGIVGLFFNSGDTNREPQEYWGELKMSFPGGDIEKSKAFKIKIEPAITD